MSSIAMAPHPGQHGGDGAALARRLGIHPSQVLDLSMTLNPFAPDLRPRVQAALDDGVLSRYPDPGELRAAVAGALQVAESRVVVTNGGAEAIMLAATVLGQGTVIEPEFSLYAEHLGATGTCLPGPSDGPRFRSNPHSPTGVLAGEDERAGVWDEAFYPMSTGRWTRGDACRGAMVLGSLTKLFACPGLRAGYLVAPDPEMAERIRRIQPRWSVNALAGAVLGDLVRECDLALLVEQIATSRAELADLLRSHGLSVRAGDAPWVLVEGDPDLRERLAASWILVRDCTSFSMPGVFRVSVTTERSLDRLDAALAGRPRPGGLGGPGSRLAASSASSVRRKAGPREGPPALRAGALMVCGTGSDSGKTALVTGICRLLKRRGVRVAPFKGQNMSLNSWVTAGGHEIGRAQGIQAIAAGCEPDAAMNPVLLKPTSDRTSQVIVMGSPYETCSAAEFQALKKQLRPLVLEALDGLRSSYDVVVCEGAGSPAEVNLLSDDLVNLGLARDAGIPALLVGDIERGGVLAALLGTVAILPDSMAQMLGGFIINKFRGDPGILLPGVEEVEARTGLAGLGVVPWTEGLAMDAEDSLSFTLGPGALGRAGSGPASSGPASSGPASSGPASSGRAGSGRASSDPGAPAESGVLDVAVVALPHLANATDVDPLASEPCVRLRALHHARDLGRADMVVIPGTKATVWDLAWLRDVGLDAALRDLARRDDGPVLLGICGGYQMLGVRIEDGVESQVASLDGLALLDVETRFEPAKVVRRTAARVLGPAPLVGAGPMPSSGHPNPMWVSGYEIHHGRTRPIGSSARPFAEVEGEAGPVPEGAYDASGSVIGTSLHGLFENDGFRRSFLRYVAARRGVRITLSPWGFSTLRERRIDALADLVEAHCDLEAILDLVGSGRRDPRRSR